jgi:nitrogen regulatory protein PII 1
MKMIRAVIRPEKEYEVVEALAKAGFPALTKVDVTGRGRQQGIQVGSALYEELAKVQILLVVDDSSADKALKTILETGKTGNFGDGKVFVTDVKEVYTIRTGKKEEALAAK